MVIFNDIVKIEGFSNYYILPDLRIYSSHCKRFIYKHTGKNGGHWYSLKKDKKQTFIVQSQLKFIYFAGGDIKYGKKLAKLYRHYKSYCKTLEYARMYRSGMSLRQISTEMGVDKNWIRESLKKIGVYKYQPPQKKICKDRKYHVPLNRRGKYYTQKFGSKFEKINPDKVFERDDFVCHICGEKTKQRDGIITKDYPTVDHIIPLSKGGDHTYANVKTAHMYCNSKKHDKIAG